MINHSDYSCDKCTREASWLCKNCLRTAEKPPTRFKRKKKTGCETPEFRSKVSMPPVRPPKPPTSGSNAVKPNPNYVPPDSVKPQCTPLPIPVTELPSRHPRSVAKFAIDTEDKLDILMTNYPDAIKVEGATIYWSDDKMALLVTAPQEWKDCLFGGKELPNTDKENNKCKEQTL